MSTFEASVRVQVKGAIYTVCTEVCAPSCQDARWLLWAEFEFHSILTGPVLVRVKQSP